MTTIHIALNTAGSRVRGIDYTYAQPAAMIDRLCADWKDPVTGELHRKGTSPNPNYPAEKLREFAAAWCADLPASYPGRVLHDRERRPLEELLGKHGARPREREIDARRRQFEAFKSARPRARFVDYIGLECHKWPSADDPNVFAGLVELYGEHLYFPLARLYEHQSEIEGMGMCSYPVALPHPSNVNAANAYHMRIVSHAGQLCANDAQITYDPIFCPYAWRPIPAADDAIWNGVTDPAQQAALWDGIGWEEITDDDARGYLRDGILAPWGGEAPDSVILWDAISDNVGWYDEQKLKHSVRRDLTTEERADCQRRSCERVNRISRLITQIVAA